MLRNRILSLVAVACLILIGACSKETGSPGDNSHHKAQDHTEIKSTLDEKSVIVLNGYTPLRPHADAKKLNEHYSE